MAELRTQIGGETPRYRVRIPVPIVGIREVRRPVAPVRQPAEGHDDHCAATANATTEAAVTAPVEQAKNAVPVNTKKRAYNREYMRQWRRRNQERYREYNREYQRKKHVQRKINRILHAPQDRRTLCGYGCGRPAVETIERIDPRTWKPVQMPYCGHC